MTRKYYLNILLTLLLSSSAIATIAQSKPAAKFPLGVFAAPTASFPFLESIGINYVHKYGLGKYIKKLDQVKLYLDAAQKHHLKVMFHLSGSFWLKQPNGLKQMQLIVERFKNHPALGFWLLYDEPSIKRGSSVKKLMPYYKMLKSSSPNIPVGIVTNWIAEWREYTTVLDYHLVDMYPVRDQPFPNSNLQYFSKFTAQALALNKPVIAIAQMINWKSFSNQAHVKDLDKNKFRYPTTAELRYFCYSSLAQGISGLFFFSYLRSLEHSDNWTQTVFADVIRDFSKFTKAIGNNRPQINKFAQDANLFMARWVNKNGEWIVLVNDWPLERDIDLWTEGKVADARLLPLGATRKLAMTVKNNKIKLRMKPWEVFIWQVSR
jgi:hypothetical protein